MARYTVLQGDTINSVAKRAGITTAQLLARNPSLTPGSMSSFVGQPLRLGAGNSIKKVTFADIARTVGMTKEQLLAMNPQIAAAYGNTPAFQGMDFTGMDVNIPGGGGFFKDNNVVRNQYRDPNTGTSFGDDTSYVPGQTAPTTPGPTPLPGLADIPVPGGLVANDSTLPDPEDTAAADQAAQDAADQQAESDAEEQEQQNQNAMQMAIAAFPWIETIGLGGQVLTWIQQGYEGQALVGLIRQEPAWETMFVGLRREDGTLRMDERQYLSTMDGYRDVLQNYQGSAGLNYSNAELSNFMVNGLDINELGDRLRLFDQIVQGGEEIRNAFYVYGGISMSDEDLYNYVVDPFTQTTFDEQYALADHPTYAEFIGATTDVVSASLDGSVPRDQVSETVDLLYHGGNPGGGDYLSLSELTNAFELAMLGSTATTQGLVLPDLATLQQIRAAGVSRSQALQSYGRFARDRNLINAIVSRVGGDEFTQNEFEQGVFLSDPTVTNELQRAEKQEKSFGKGGGSFAFSQNKGRLAQAGASAFRN